MYKVDIESLKRLSIFILDCNNIKDIKKFKENNYSYIKECFSQIENKNAEQLDDVELYFAIITSMSILTSFLLFFIFRKLAFPIFTDESRKITTIIILGSLLFGFFSGLVITPIILKSIYRKRRIEDKRIKRYLGVMQHHILHLMYLDRDQNKDIHNYIYEFENDIQFYLNMLNRDIKKYKV